MERDVQLGGHHEFTVTGDPTHLGIFATLPLLSTQN